MMLYTGSPYLQMEIDNMEYRFKNGHTTMENRVSPNGTLEVVIQLMPHLWSTAIQLFDEVSAWVKTEQGVEHTVLLMKHTNHPYMVAFQSRGYDE